MVSSPTTCTRRISAPQGTQRIAPTRFREGRVHLALEDEVKWTRPEISTSMCGSILQKSVIVSGEPHQQAWAPVGCCCTAQNGHGRPATDAVHHRGVHP